jgi:hypothetical protein
LFGGVILDSSKYGLLFRKQAGRLLIREFQVLGPDFVNKLDADFTIIEVKEVA